MKGVYTSGVLDFFLEKDVEFSTCLGVSAGICTACSYLSKQHGRGYRISVDYLKDKRYCSVYSLLTTGDLFGVQMCYEEIPDVLDPYDYEAFGRYQGKVYAVVTNVETGRPEYKRIQDVKRDIVAVRASSSLPLVSRLVEIEGSLYLDGGISDSIPIRKSIRMGNEKNVVVLTKPVGYYKKPTSPNMMRMIEHQYKKYPKVVENMAMRHIRYNKTLRYLEEQEAKGNVFVIRPQKDLKIGRIEKNREKLDALYQEGYQEAKEQYDALLAYMAGDAKGQL